MLSVHEKTLVSTGLFLLFNIGDNYLKTTCSSEHGVECATSYSQTQHKGIKVNGQATTCVYPIQSTLNIQSNCNNPDKNKLILHIHKMQTVPETAVKPDITTSLIPMQPLGMSCLLHLIYYVIFYP